MKPKRTNSRKAAVITNSRWLTYATAGAASAFACAHSAEGTIHYSGPINRIFRGNIRASFRLDQPGDVIWLSDYAGTFPSYYAERRFQLVGNQMRIGRRSVSRGLAPEIDLTGPPADPGISRLHAVLIATPDGNWAVLDPGSANGTLVNGSEIVVGDQVPLNDGDRINLGAWTTITVHRG